MDQSSLIFHRYRHPQSQFFPLHLHFPHYFQTLFLEFVDLFLLSLPLLLKIFKSQGSTHNNIESMLIS